MSTKQQLLFPWSVTAEFETFKWAIEQKLSACAQKLLLDKSHFFFCFIIWMPMLWSNTQSCPIRSFQVYLRSCKRVNEEKSKIKNIKARTQKTWNNLPVVSAKTNKQTKVHKKYQVRLSGKLKQLNWYWWMLSCKKHCQFFRKTGTQTHLTGDSTREKSKNYKWVFCVHWPVDRHQHRRSASSNTKTRQHFLF